MTVRIAVRRFVGFTNALHRQASTFAGPVEVHPYELDELYAIAAAGGRRSDTVYDIVVVVTDWIAALVAQGALRPIDRLLSSAPPDDYPSGWTRSLWDAQQIDGATYGTPFHDGPMMLLYRTDLFDNPVERARFADTHGYDLHPATTWSEFVDIAAHFTRPHEGIWGTVLAGKPDGHNNVYDFLLQVWTRSGSIAAADGSPLFNSDIGLEALTFLHDLWRVHRVVNPAALDFDSVEAGMVFARGEAAMTANWAGIAAFASLPGSTTQGQIGCSAAPRGDASGGRHTSLNIYWILAITSEAVDVDEAWRFIRHATSAASDRVTSEEGATGTRLSTWNDRALQKEHTYYQHLAVIHDDVHSPPKHPRWTALIEVLSGMVNDTINGRMQPHDALTAAEREWLRQLKVGA